MIEAHEDSLVAHLESCEEAEKNKDEAEKYKLRWNNTRKQLERQHSLRNSPNAPMVVIIDHLSLECADEETFIAHLFNGIEQNENLHAFHALLLQYF